MHRPRAPQPQGIGVTSLPADDGRIVGDGEDRLLRRPEHLPGLFRRGHTPAEADLVGALAPFEFPWIAKGQPILGHFNLSAAIYALLEQPVIVADAVAKRWDASGGHRLHVAGSESAEAAIAKRSVRFEVLDIGEVDAKLAQRLGHRSGQAEIVQRVGERAADEEFQ